MGPAKGEKRLLDKRKQVPIAYNTRTYEYSRNTPKSSTQFQCRSGHPSMLAVDLPNTNTDQSRLPMAMELWIAALALATSRRAESTLFSCYKTSAIPKS